MKLDWSHQTEFKKVDFSEKLLHQVREKQQEISKLLVSSGCSHAQMDLKAIQQPTFELTFSNLQDLNRFKGAIRPNPMKITTIKNYRSPVYEKQADYNKDCTMFRIMTIIYGEAMDLDKCPVIICDEDLHLKFKTCVDYFRSLKSKSFLSFTHISHKNQSL